MRPGEEAGAGEMSCSSPYSSTEKCAFVPMEGMMGEKWDADKMTFVPCEEYLTGSLAVGFAPGDEHFKGPLDKRAAKRVLDAMKNGELVDDALVRLVFEHELHWGAFMEAADRTEELHEIYVEDAAKLVKSKQQQQQSLECSHNGNGVVQHHHLVGHSLGTQARGLKGLDACVCRGGVREHMQLRDVIMRNGHHPHMR